MHNVKTLLIVIVAALAGFIGVVLGNFAIEHGAPRDAPTWAGPDGIASADARPQRPG